MDGSDNMTIQIMLNNSPNNKIDKDVKMKKEVTGKIKEDTDIINPSFIVKSAGTDFNNANYLYCFDLERYYFIKTVIEKPGGLIEIVCHEDMLMSFKNSLRKQSGIVARQEQIYNTYLQDGTFKAYAYPLIQQKSFPSGFSDNTTILLSVVGGAN